MRARLDRLAGSARLRARQAQAAGQVAMPRVAAAAAAPAGRWLPIIRDALRFPGYYVSRLPRVPGLLARHGLGGLLSLAMVVAASGAEIKRQYRLRGALGGGLFSRMLERLRSRRRASPTQGGPQGPVQSAAGGPEGR
jgi:hypothetical protein